jgi:hypothetical protein
MANRTNEAKAAIEALLNLLDDDTLATVDTNVRPYFRRLKPWKYREEIAEALDHQARIRGEAFKG